MINLANEFILEHYANRHRRLPVLGRIKIGERVLKETSSGLKMIPRKLDHFIITKNIRDENGQWVIDHELMQRVAQATGQSVDKITKIPIMFPFNSIDLNVQTSLLYVENTREGKIICYGNGKGKALRRTDRGIFEVKCPCNLFPVDEPFSVGERRCKPFGRLNVIIRDANTFGGIWIFNTTSWRALYDILFQLRYFKTLTDGILAGIVFVLELNAEKVKVGDTFQTIFYPNLRYEAKFDKIEDDNPLIKLRIRAKELQDKTLKSLDYERRLLKWMPQELLTENLEEKAIQEEFYPDEESDRISKELDFSEGYAEKIQDQYSLTDEEEHLDSEDTTSIEVSFVEDEKENVTEPLPEKEKETEAKVIALNEAKKLLDPIEKAKAGIRPEVRPQLEDASRETARREAAQVAVPMEKMEKVQNLEGVQKKDFKKANPNQVNIIASELRGIFGDKASDVVEESFLKEISFEDAKNVMSLIISKKYEDALNYLRKLKDKGVQEPSGTSKEDKDKPETPSWKEEYLKKYEESGYSNRAMSLQKSERENITVKKMIIKDVEDLKKLGILDDDLSDMLEDDEYLP